MGNLKNIKLLCCIFGSFMLVLVQSPIFVQATLSVFSGSIGNSLFTESLYNLLGVISFAGVTSFIAFSVTLIISNFKFYSKQIDK